jgi:hypothetical protein
MSGIPVSVFSSFFKVDGRSFCGWKFRGIPPELIQPVCETVQNLTRLLEDGLLPMDMPQLAVLGLMSLSERYANEPRSIDIPSDGPSEPV